MVARDPHAEAGPDDRGMHGRRLAQARRRPRRPGRRPVRDRDRQVDHGRRGLRRRRPAADRRPGGRHRPREHGLRLRRPAGRGDPRDAPAAPLRRRPRRRRSPAAAAAPAAAASAPVPAPASAAPLPAPAPAAGEGRLRISPRASRAAAEAGIDPRTIAGGGPGGRITERDVRAAIAATQVAPAPGPAPAVPVASRPAPDSPPRSPPPRARRNRARSAGCAGSSPNVSPAAGPPPRTSRSPSPWTSPRLLALRAELKAAGTNLTVTDFVLAATAQTLAEFPDVNSRTDGVSVWPRRRVHLGIAVSMPGRPRRAGHPGRRPPSHRRPPRSGRRPRGRGRARAPCRWTT